MGNDQPVKSPVFWETALKEGSPFSRDVGLCVKDLDRKVLFQNQACKDRCGVKYGTVCDTGCMKGYISLAGSIPLQGGHISSGERKDDTSWENIVVNDGSSIITIQCPTEKRRALALKLLFEAGLTQSELRIATDRLDRFSNSEICKRLFISKGTLKTHLNHIYAKIPGYLRKHLRSLANR